MPKAAAWPARTVPAEIVVPPVKVLSPESVRVPAPCLAKPAPPVIAELTVKVVAVATSKAPPPLASVTPRLALKEVVAVVFKVP